MFVSKRNSLPNTVDLSVNINIGFTNIIIHPIEQLMLLPRVFNLEWLESWNLHNTGYIIHSLIRISLKRLSYTHNNKYLNETKLFTLWYERKYPLKTKLVYYTTISYSIVFVFSILM